MGEALSKFVEEAQSLYAGFESATVFSIGGWNVSQYTLYMFLALILVLLIVLIGGQNSSLSLTRNLRERLSMLTSSSLTVLVEMLLAKATRSTFLSWQPYSL